ncbi:hypothetical protein V1478_008363 [Vespula squamosa]|uniref:Ribosomal protein S8 n=1 Tax=Vespula squamosa TaxID=30214 RepID=A0ABD2AVA0_VESSQ
METLKEALREINLSIGRRKIELVITETVKRVNILRSSKCALSRYTDFCNLMRKLGFKSIKQEGIVRFNNIVREIMNINVSSFNTKNKISSSLVNNSKYIKKKIVSKKTSARIGS